MKAKNIRFSAVALMICLLGVGLSGAQANSGQLLYLPLDEPVWATTFADLSGTGHNGICTGGQCPTAGQPGRVSQAVDFTPWSDSNGQFINVPDSNIGAAFAVALWVYVRHSDFMQELVAYSSQWKSCYTPNEVRQ